MTPTKPELQLPAKRVIEGEVVPPLRITITVDAIALQSLQAQLEECRTALLQLTKKAALIRPLFPFENLDEGAINLAHPP